jgi:hypothetical protein
MALHSTLLELRQHPDETMKTCLQWVQKYGDKLTTVGKSFDPTDFNLYLLKGLRFKFLKILSQTLTTRPKLVSLSRLHNLLLSHESLRKDEFRQLTVSGTSVDNSIQPTLQVGQLVEVLEIRLETQELTINLSYA